MRKLCKSIVFAKWQVPKHNTVNTYRRFRKWSYLFNQDLSCWHEGKQFILRDMIFWKLPFSPLLASFQSTKHRMIRIWSDIVFRDSGLDHKIIPFKNQQILKVHRSLGRTVSKGIHPPRLLGFEVNHDGQLWSSRWFQYWLVVGSPTHLKKYAQVKMGSSSPSFGVNIKNLWVATTWITYTIPLSPQGPPETCTKKNTCPCNLDHLPQKENWGWT